MPPPDEPLIKILAGFAIMLCLTGLLSIVGIFGLGVWKFIELVF